jgi:hypothetical protein
MSDNPSEEPVSKPHATASFSGEPSSAPTVLKVLSPEATEREPVIVKDDCLGCKLQRIFFGPPRTERSVFASGQTPILGQSPDIEKLLAREDQIVRREVARPFGGGVEVVMELVHDELTGLRPAIVDQPV